jgi:serine/threonine protein kinase
LGTNDGDWHQFRKMIDSENTTSDNGPEDFQDKTSAENNSEEAEFPIVSPITSSQQPDLARAEYDSDSIDIDRINSIVPPEAPPHSANIDMIGNSEFSVEQDDSTTSLADSAHSTDIDMIGDSEFSAEQDNSTTSLEDSAHSSDIDRIGNGEFSVEQDNSTTSLEDSAHSTDIDSIGNSEFSVEQDDSTTSLEDLAHSTDKDMIGTSSAEIDSTAQGSTEVAPSSLNSASLKSLIRSSADKEKTFKADVNTKDVYTETKESEVIGQILNEQFVIMDIIGRGEASLVFSAMELESQQMFAVKTPKRFSNELKEHFKAAALLHGKLEHPNIAKTNCYIESPSGIPYLLLENIQGASLKQLFDSMQTIEEEETIVVIVSQICDALEQAHNLNIAHGKLSPGNIFLTEQDERLCIKVLDFAVADVLTKDSAAAGSTKNLINPYQSPENTSSIESDIYSLGVITYQMVAGRLPDVRLSSLGESELTSLASFRPDLNCIQALDQVLAEALEQNPDWRLNSVASFKNGVEEWITAVRRERCQQALSSSGRQQALSSSDHAVVSKPISPGNTPESVLQSNAESQPKTTNSEIGIQRSAQAEHLTGIQKARDKVRTTLHRLVALAHQPLELLQQEPDERSIPIAPTLIPNFNDGSSLVGQLLFDSYAILDVLKEGPTTIAYLAKHFNSNRHLVLKTVRHRSLFEAFSRDVRAQAALKHPNIVEHLGYIEASDGTPFSVSEYVEGINLAELLSSGGRVESEEDLAEIVLQAIDAVAYAHGLGIVHANLKPTNILFCSDAEAVSVRMKLLDFAPAKARAELALASQDETLCAKLDFNFMSPEQVLHGISSFNTDVYNMGQLLYMSATGRPAHPCSTLTELKIRFSNSDCPYSLIEERPDLRAIDSLDRLLKSATVIDPANRLQSIAEFKSGVDSWIDEVRQQRTENQRQIDLEVKRRRTKEVVKQTIYNLVALRQQQLDQEQTVMMKFASATATSGPRQSPIKSATKLVSTIVITCLICVVSTAYVFTNFEQLKSVWSNASRSLASLFMKHSNSEPENEFALDKPVNKITPKKTNGTNQQASSPNQSSASADQTGSPTNAPISSQTRFNYAESPDYSQYVVKDRLGKRRADDTPSSGEIPRDPVNFKVQRPSSYPPGPAGAWAARMKGR